LTRKLFLHVGPAKTGTSAVQDVLRRHDGSIVIYPKIGLWADGSHHNLVLNYFGEFNRPEVVRENPAELLARVGNETRGSTRDIVISSEVLAGRKDIAGFVAALERQIGESLRVECVAVVREHFERAASLYNQRVKDAVTRETRDPDVFLAEQARSLCYANLVKRLRHTGFGLSVLNYHPAESCVERVLALFAFPQTNALNHPPRNVSLSRATLVASLAANRIVGSGEKRDRFVDALRQMPEIQAPSASIFNAEAVLAADRRFGKDRNFLLRRFGIEFQLPDFSEQRFPFGIDATEFEHICKIARQFGDFGRDVVEAIRPYIRL